jgi:hypothetical protein
VTARQLTPEQKAEGARAVLAELRRLFNARLDYMQCALGAREICDHFELPWPAALCEDGALESPAALSLAVDEYAAFCEHGAALFEGAG